MMRSLYSGVAGMKTHQTKMDVIGNNIANVNTVGFKASSVTFSDLLYQTTQSASGANTDTGTTGVNAKQIGLGSKVNSITTAMGTGGTQTTDSALDCMINGDAYFIVKSGGQNYFTKAGSFFVDGTGTLCTASGAAVQGWQVNAAGTDIERDRVSNLNVMSAENMRTAPEATKNAYVTGNIDTTDSQLPTGEKGAPIAVNFYDSLGNSYTLKLKVNSTATDGAYTVSVDDVYDADGNSILCKKNAQGEYEAVTGVSVSFGGKTYTAKVAADKKSYEIEGDAISLTFSTATGAFQQVTDVADTKSVTFKVNDGKAANETPFQEVDLNFSSLTQYASSGKSNLESQRGKVDGSGEGAGRPMGDMTGLSIDQEGKIFGSYDNGITKLLGQIAVTTFANATGLEAVGNSMFATTQNSGDFDGIGKSVTEAGGKLTTSALEMSNVDLAAEFTNMITTQRGFQANSRIITTSDTMLEELINLKR